MVVARPKVLVVEDDESLCQAIELGWMKPSRPREEARAYLIPATSPTRSV